VENGVDVGFFLLRTTEMSSQEVPKSAKPQITPFENAAIGAIGKCFFLFTSFFLVARPSSLRSTIEIRKKQTLNTIT